MNYTLDTPRMRAYLKKQGLNSEDVYRDAGVPYTSKEFFEFINSIEDDPIESIHIRLSTYLKINIDELKRLLN